MARDPARFRNVGTGSRASSAMRSMSSGATGSEGFLARTPEGAPTRSSLPFTDVVALLRK
jgi:hypothetical protein